MIQNRLRYWIGLVLAAYLVLPVFGVQAELSPERGLYGFMNESSTIVKVDPAIGLPTGITEIEEDLIANALAYDTSTETMYAIYYPEGIFREGMRPVYFGSIDLATGDSVRISSSLESETLRGMAYDSRNDVLYATESWLGQLVTIDRSTGATTTVGPFDIIGTLRIHALAYCPVNDTLYGIDLDSIYAIDRVTGEAFEIGPHGLPVGYMGLTYDENNGVLYATTSGSTEIYRINLETGDAFPLGDIGVALSCLASMPSQGELNVLFINAGLKDGEFIDGLEGLDIDGLSKVNAGSMTSSTAYLEQFDVVLVASAGIVADADLLGNNLADYVDAGGGLGLYAGTLALGDSSCLGGRIIGPEYSPLVPAVMERLPSEAVALISHDITDGVATLTTERIMQITELQGGGIALGTYDTGYLLGAYRDDKPIAVINVFPSDLTWSGDLMLMTENLIYWCVDNGATSSVDMDMDISIGIGGGGGGGGCFISGLSMN